MHGHTGQPLYLESVHSLPCSKLDDPIMLPTLPRTLLNFHLSLSSRLLTLETRQKHLTTLLQHNLTGHATLSNYVTPAHADKATKLPITRACSAMPYPAVMVSTSCHKTLLGVGSETLEEDISSTGKVDPTPSLPYDAMHQTCALTRQPTYMQQ